MGYKTHAIKGISWSGALRVSIRAISVLRVAILAHFLSPDQFGLFGIATIALALLEVFLETGVNVFLIQEKSDIRKYIDSAWVVSIVRGLLMFSVLVLTSPLIAAFFKNSAALGILLLISLVPLLRGFINPSIVYFQKEIEFHKEFAYRVVLFAIDTIFTIILAILTHSAYSMVIGAIVSVVFEILISFKFATPRPKLSFDKNYLSLIFHRGKWVTLFGIFSYLAQEGDTIAVGRLMSTVALGQYNMAYTVGTLPIEASDVVNQVVFPVYTKIAHDRKRLFDAFAKTTLILTLGTGLISLFIYIFTHPIVQIFLGDNWLTIIPVLKLIAIYGVLRAIFGSASSLFLAVEKQNYVTIMTFFRVFGLAITIVPLIGIYGLVGAAYSVIFSVLIEIPIIVFLVAKVFSSKTRLTK
ncbi:MAG TPA: oligosaccharide flippase family protein [Patescibacteria group bacterium]|nr:oligosaccharide flippase family protein [Patescibacteria group bacterium]